MTRPELVHYSCRVTTPSSLLPDHSIFTALSHIVPTALTVKTRIWLTISGIVGVFTAFLLLFFPAQQERFFLRKYNDEVENQARTVALGVKIAMKEQNFEGVETALDFAKADPRLRFVALFQLDSVRDAATGRWRPTPTLLNPSPATARVTTTTASDETVLVKHARVALPEFRGTVVVGYTTDEIIRQMHDIQLTALLVSALVLTLGIGVGWWLARTISEPVLALRDAAYRVGAGDRTQQVRAASGDEIGELTVAFNRMVTDLAAAEEREQQKTNDLVEKNHLIEQSRDALAHTLADLKQTQSQLVHSEKMASLGQMTAGVAHEINNPINFVSVGIESLRNNMDDIRSVLDEYRGLVPDDSAETLRTRLLAIRALEKRLELPELVQEAEELFASIRNGARRTTEIVKSLRSFSRLDEDALKPVSLEEGLDSTLTILRSQLKDQIRIERAYAPLPLVPCYPGPLNQVFMNILTNAAQAIQGVAGGDGHGVIRITTAVEEAGWATVRIRDSGPGMPAEVKNRIFEPFFTTKDVGTGTGLGLSITFGIMERHHGRIGVESAPGQGTEFILQLPLEQSFAA